MLHISSKASNTFDFFFSHSIKYPTPANLSYLWNFGFISSVFLAIQLISGFFLAMHYCSDISTAFDSVDHIMRDVNYGWLLRSVHANGASFFFFVVYVHIARGIYFHSYVTLTGLVWYSGLVLFILMMASAFIGYVLPWGQMSFWGATVITNLFSIIPEYGEKLVYWLWGGFSVSAPTLSRFFALHYILPFVLLLLVVLHILLVHVEGSSNPLWAGTSINKYYLPLYPYFIIKDLVGLVFVLIPFFYFVCQYPDMLGHPDNYIEANPLVTPTHIVPEWYFLPFYAALRSVPDKAYGIVLMGSVILTWFKFPMWHGAASIGFTYWRCSFFFIRIFYPIIFFMTCYSFILLGWLGSKPVEEPYVYLTSIMSSFYFTISAILISWLYFFFEAYFVMAADNDSSLSNKKNNKMLNQKNKGKWFIKGKIKPFRPLFISLDLLYIIKSIPHTNYGVFGDDFLWSQSSDYYFYVDLFILFIICICFLVSILMAASLLFSNSVSKYIQKSKNNVFECGFEPIHTNSSSKLNLHYFKVCVMFLIFDIELIFILPWVINVKFFLLNKAYFFFLAGIPIVSLIFLSLVYEYVNKMVDWSEITI